MTPETSAKTIQYVAYSFFGFAIIWGLAPYQSINEPARILLDILDWPFGDRAALSRSEMWLSAIGAGLTVAISIFLIGVVAPAIRASNRQVIRVTIWAFIAWYVVDSAGSYASGVGSNVFFNTIFLAMVLFPLLLVRLEKDDSP